MLGISKKEFYRLVQEGKLHPLNTTSKQLKIPLSQVMALKAEMTHRQLTLPHEKFIMAMAHFTKSPFQINERLVDLGFHKAPVEYIDRLKTYVETDKDMPIIREDSLEEFFRALGSATDLVRRDDVKLMVELLTMIQKGEEEIRTIVQAKTGREYGTEDILRFQEYFFNWKAMDPESMKFYFDFVTDKREKILRDCAYRRADYFIYYALGIDFGGDIADLLERSCLGIMYKLNLLIDGHAYGEAAGSMKDLESLAKIVMTLLDGAKACRDGEIPKSKQKEFADHVIPATVSRTDFLGTEAQAGAPQSS